MTTKLINRLNLLVKQLLWLNSILEKTLQALPEELSESFMESVEQEIVGIKMKLNYLHEDINKLMSSCYKKHLDSLKMLCEVESKLELDKKFPSEENKLLDKLSENSDII